MEAMGAQISINGVNIWTVQGVHLCQGDVYEIFFLNTPLINYIISTALGFAK